MGKKRRRRSFSPEFKAEAIRVVRESGKSVSTVARELDLTETALRRWVIQAEIDAGRSGSGALTTDERAELTQLRRDVKTLRMERDILKNGPGAGPLPAGPEAPCAVRTVSAPEERPTAFWSMRARQKHGPGTAADLKVRAGIRQDTLFPPALKGWNDPARPVPRPRTCSPPHPWRSRRAPTPPLKLSCLKPYTSGVSSALDARAWRNGRRSGLEGNLSARRE